MPRTILALTAILAALGAVGAQDFAVTVTHGGLARAGRTATLRCDIQAGSEPVRGDLATTSGVLDQPGPSLFRLPVDVPAGTSKRYWLTTVPELYGRTTAVRLRFADGRQVEVACDGAPAQREELLVAHVSKAGAGLQVIDGLVRLGGWPVKLVQLREDEVPPSAAGLAPANVLILSGDGFTAQSPEVKRAVERWVGVGGRLILHGGPTAAGLWQDATIQRLTPVRAKGLTFLSSSAFRPLVDGLGVTLPRGGPYAVTRITDVGDAWTLRAPGGQPLLVESDYGAGSVVVVAAPLDAPPLSRLSARLPLLRMILGTSDRFAGATGYGTEVRQSLATKLPENRTPGSGLVLGFLLTYLLVLIPLQFIILRRIGRRELTWLVTPVVVTVFSAAAYGLGARLKGEEVVAQTISVLVVPSGSTLAMLGQTTAIFSPARGEFDLTVPADALRLDELADGWTEGGYDEYYRRRNPLDLDGSGRPTRLDDVPINMWSVRAFELDRAVELPGGIEVTADSRGKTWSGRVVNRTGWTLREVRVTLDGASCRLGDLPPGKSAAARAGGQARPAQSPRLFAVETEQELRSEEAWADGLTAYVELDQPPFGGLEQARCRELRLIRVVLPQPDEAVARPGNVEFDDQPGGPPVDRRPTQVFRLPPRLRGSAATLVVRDSNGDEKQKLEAFVPATGRWERIGPSGSPSIGRTLAPASRYSDPAGWIELRPVQAGGRPPDVRLEVVR